MNKDILTIYASNQTVFSMDDLAILLLKTNEDNLKAKIAYYVKRGYLLRVRRGFFAKNDQYDREELATKIYAPSYISFETILGREGVIFQSNEETLSVASYLSREIAIEDQATVTMRRIKPEILLNKVGLINKGNYYEASKERAFTDTVYLQGEVHFDNLRSIDWKKCMEIVKIYKSPSLEQKIKNYKKDYVK